jgi:nitric oxide reductase NorQ protein
MDLCAYLIDREPYYRSIADEIALFEAAYSARMPLNPGGHGGDLVHSDHLRLGRRSD